MKYYCIECKKDLAKARLWCDDCVKIANERRERQEKTVHYATLVFWKDGVPKEEIERRLKSLSDVIGGCSPDWVGEHNDLYGPPVWYIP